MKKAIRTLFYNLVILFILLIIIELIFGGWIWSSNNLNNLGIVRNVHFKHKLQNLYPDSAGIAYYTRDKFGFRGKSTFNLPEKIDILTIGGSTTDQRFIDDSKTWQEILESNFRNSGQEFSIANAGVDGQTTFGHIKNFELWFPEVKNLKPQYFLFYIGINDFYIITDHLSYDRMAVKHKNGLDKLKATIRNNSALYNLFRKIRGMIKSKELGVYHKKIDFNKFDLTDSGVANKELVDLYKRENLTGFRKRLQTLIALSKKYGAKPIFVTQPSAKYLLRDGTLKGIKEVSQIEEHNYNGVDYYNLLSELNNVIYEVAGNEYMVVELTSLPIWEQDDFYDWFHMTPKGAKKVGNEIYNQLKSKL